MPRCERRAGTAVAALAAAVLVTGCAATDSSVELPYTDDFAGDCRWPEETGGLVSDCADGGYRLVVEDATDAEGGSALLLEEATSSVAVEARGEVVKRSSGGDDDYLAYGVSCVIDREGTSGYTFVVTERGEWAILRSRGKDQPDILREGMTESGGPGSHTVGGMCVDAGGGRTLLALEVDGDTVATLEDEGGHTRFEGFALTVTSTRAGAEVRFDDVRASVPSPREIEAAEDAERIIIDDDFGDAGSGWPTESDEDVSLSYDDGGYRVLAKTSTPSWTFAPVHASVGALAVETRVAYAGGPPTVGYGLLCYGSRDDDGYVFTVSPSGGYAIFRETPDDVRVVADGASDFGGDADALGLRAARVPGKGRTTHLALFVDGREVVVATDDDGVRRFGLVGVYVQSDEGGSDVLFDDFRAEELPPEDAEALQARDALDTPAPADETEPAETVFADDFSRPSDRWPTGRDPTGRLAYREGSYRITVTEGSSIQQISQTLARRVPALRIDAELVERKRSPGDDGYGVACVAGDVAFVFEIDAEAGTYGFLVDEGESGVELDSGASDAIAGIGKVNRLRAECVPAPDGIDLLLFVNGRDVGRLTWHGEAGPFDSLSVRVYSDQGGTEVELDDLVARAG